MAQAKIKSRDEKLFDAWQEYYRCNVISNKVDELLLKHPVYAKLDCWFDKEGFMAGKLIDEKTKVPLWRKGNSCKDSRIVGLNLDLAKKIREYLDMESKISDEEKDDIIRQMVHWAIYDTESKKLKKKADEIYKKYSTPRYFNSLSVKNFKGFSDKNSEEENTIKIKPITLIYGPNSFGKSSIMQSLLLLNQTVSENRDFENIPLSPKGSMVDLGIFEDFINNKDTSKELTIELGFPLNNYVCGAIADQRYSLKEISYDLHFKKDGDLKFTKMDFYEKAPGSNQKRYVSHWEKNVYNKYSPKQTSFFTLKETESDYHYNAGWKHIIQSEQLEKVLKNIIYISSYRTAPERVFVTADNAGKYVGKTGQYTTDILLYRNNKELRKNVNEWLYNIAKYKLSLNNKSVTSVMLNDEETKVNNVNLLDLGSGIAHVLPIITQAFVSKEDMILIEEPEIHLHPRAQAELGSMFAQVIKNTENTFIIETHSENILLRLRKLIRHGELSKDDVSVIYVDKKEGKGSYCIPLNLDDDGHITNINDIPGGFFEEGFNDLFDINKE